MREIKFRAWEENGKNMLSSNEVGDHTLNDLKQLPYVLMQYTGLKDKNGTEIYEGDIVRILYTDWASKSEDDPRTLEQYLIDIAHHAEVVFEYDKFCLRSFSKKYKEYSTSSIRPGNQGYIEIIGNIHENPELIEKNN